MNRLVLFGVLSAFAVVQGAWKDRGLASWVEVSGRLDGITGAQSKRSELDSAGPALWKRGIAVKPAEGEEGVELWKRRVVVSPVEGLEGLSPVMYAAELSGDNYLQKRWNSLPVGKGPEDSFRQKRWGAQKSSAGTFGVGADAALNGGAYKQKRWAGQKTYH